MKTLFSIVFIFVCRIALCQDLNVEGNLQLNRQRSTIFTQGEYFSEHRGGIQFLTYNSGTTFIFQPTNAQGTAVNSTLTLGGFGYFTENIVGLAVSGSAGIGTNNTRGYRLAVAGKILTDEIVVMAQSNWPDYVFESDYKLPSLTAVAAYIAKHKHLPEIPSAAEVEKDGSKLGEMNMALLKKIEELTLYLIEQNNTIDKQTKDIESLQAIANQQQKQIQVLMNTVNPKDNH